MSKEFMLTTIDNPFNPFTETEEWMAYDLNHSFASACCQLARIQKTNALMSEIETEREENRAIIEIAEQNVTGTFRLIDEDGNFVTISEAKNMIEATL